jgi:hypothetical protein
MKPKLIVKLGKITFWVIFIPVFLILSPTTPVVWLLWIKTSTLIWIWLIIDIIVLIAILWFLISAVIPPKSNESTH